MGVNDRTTLYPFFLFPLSSTPCHQLTHGFTYHYSSRIAEAEEDFDEEDEEDEQPEEIILNGTNGSGDNVSVENQHSGHSPDSTSPRETDHRMAASSVAPSDMDVASIRPLASEDGDAMAMMEDVNLESGSVTSKPPHQTDALHVPRPQGSCDDSMQVQLGSSVAPSSSAAASPRSPGGMPPSPPFQRRGEFESMQDVDGGLAVDDQMEGSAVSSLPIPISSTAEPYRSSFMKKVLSTTDNDDGEGEDGEGDAGTAAIEREEEEEDEDENSIAATDGDTSVTHSLPNSVAYGGSGSGGLAATMAAAAVAAAVAADTNGDAGESAPASVTSEDVLPPNQEEVEKEEEEGIAVPPVVINAPTAPAVSPDPDPLELPTSSISAGESLKMESLEMESSSSLVTAAAAGGGGASTTAATTPFTSAVAAANINAAAAVAAAASHPPPPPKVNMGPEWEETFKGLLYVDGVDALGRPVVVLNADAVPSNMKSSALTYVKTHLEPLVTAGHYVIVFTARKAKLPSFWIMGAYQTLPRPYRKNVQYVILVKPSGFLKAMLAFMRPFVSKKAGKKIKAVDTLEEIGESTGGEVTLHHLGRAFLENDAVVQEEEEAAAAAAAAAKASK